MAVTAYNQSINPYNWTTDPVAIGPVPTPMPPQGVVYTPQYSGGQVFGVKAPPAYTSTSKGQQAVRTMETSSGTSSVTRDNLMSMYPGYVGWNLDAAWQDYLATGGAGKTGGGGGGDTSSAAQLPYTPPTKTQLPYTPPTKTYDIGGKPVTSLATPEGAEQAIKSIYGDTDYGQYQEQFNFDPSQFLNQIESDASSQMAFLDKSQSALDEAKAAYQKLIEADYATNLSKGQGAKESSLGQLEANKVKAQQLRQDALNAAKQLYNQLSMGYQQRFGGASGASEASRAILGQEQQRQGAQINRDYMNTVNQIQAQKAETEKQYAQMVQDLDYQKQRAQYDALQTYQTNMRAIDADRTQTEIAKNQAKMQVLMQLRDNQNAVAAADRQYRQQLDAMKAQTQMQLDASLLQMQQQAKLNASTGASAVGNFGQNYSTVSSNLGQNNTTRTAPVLPSVESSVGFTSPWGYEDKDRQQSVLY